MQRFFKQKPARSKHREYKTTKLYWKISFSRKHDQDYNRNDFIYLISPDLTYYKAALIYLFFI